MKGESQHGEGKQARSEPENDPAPGDLSRAFRDKAENQQHHEDERPSDPDPVHLVLQVTHHIQFVQIGHVKSDNLHKDTEGDDQGEDVAVENALVGKIDGKRKNRGGHTNHHVKGPNEPRNDFQRYRCAERDV